jgi:hypothetical protein
MVRLQTLDLRIGVQVPASQPLILKAFRRSFMNCLRQTLQLHRPILWRIHKF